MNLDEIKLNADQKIKPGVRQIITQAWTATGSVFGSQAAVCDHDGGVGERNAKLHERNLRHGV